MRSLELTQELSNIVYAISTTCEYLWQKEWAEQNAGNISVDVTEFIEKRGHDFSEFSFIKLDFSESLTAGRCFFVTTAGSRFRDMKHAPEKNLMLIHISDSMDGFHVLWGGMDEETRPTSEFISHLMIHGSGQKIGFPFKAVVHTHPTHLIALSHIKEYTNEDAVNQLLWSMHPEMKVFMPEGIGFAPYTCPGTEELAKATIHALISHRLVLWEKHGCIAIGQGVFDAFDLIDMADKAARIFFLCRSAGCEAQGLSEKQLKEIEQQFPG
jgi:rhamnulose-1-phosphate aldolase